VSASSLQSASATGEAKEWIDGSGSLCGRDVSHKPEMLEWTPFLKSPVILRVSWRDAGVGPCEQQKKRSDFRRLRCARDCSRKPQQLHEF
jgi:hypothetical protein